MKLSVLIPAFNEVESLTELIAGIEAHAAAHAPYEIIIVDDGSDDGSGKLLEELSKTRPHLGYIILGRNYGKSAALAEGFRRCRGEFIVTMDADLQDDPAEIDNLLGKLDEGYDLVSGWKRKRHDPLNKTLPSKLFNATVRKVSGLALHDFNCGLKAYRHEVTEHLDLHGEMHRYIPVLAGWEGYRIAELPVQHHARKFGVTKFGSSRYLNGFMDLLTVTFISRRAAAPLHFFGRIAFVLLFIGFAISLYFGVSWAITHALRVRPLLILGLIMIVLGFQFASLGLLGELMIHLRGSKEVHRIAAEKESRGG